MSEDSLAEAQQSLGNPETTYPLWPPQTLGCPETSTEEVQYPLEVTYDYESVDRGLFESELTKFDRWSPLLPPLADIGLGEGQTPLIEMPSIGDWLDLDTPVFVKDESQNPTWSHKDRLNRCVVSAAVQTDARGLVVSSSGNHGASTAAYAARAGLPCIVLTAPETPPAVQRFLRTYDAAVIAIDDWHHRQETLDLITERLGYHPASTRTAIHTGHPFGPEGYKTIAYEIVTHLNRSPGTVFVPTGHAELLYGVWKGFRELGDLGVIEGTPRMIACEPAARGPLATALETDREIATVKANPTTASAIKTQTSTVRGRRAIEESDGAAWTFTEEQLSAAQTRTARGGLWQEHSGVAGIAGLLAAIDAGQTVDGPIVCLATSSGFKDGETWTAPRVDPPSISESDSNSSQAPMTARWAAVREILSTQYGLDV
ncbi:threonine synthase [Halocatena marina]|uniref:Pyridoxal-phosphate dependent enzyme n=1 Tax=Halocatena marina TaxID=2934937 RepID=A0ABD5YMY2_9EURY|nr:pyridoxal-phosphate dependent enzyme [Halocatena marina]